MSRGGIHPLGPRRNVPGLWLGGRGFEAQVRGWVGIGRHRRAVTPLLAVLALARI